MELKIKKIEDKIELDVKAQALLGDCDCDCLVWVAYSKKAFPYGNPKAFGCRQRYTAVYNPWW